MKKIFITIALCLTSSFLMAGQALGESEPPAAEEAKPLAGFEWLASFEGTWSTQFNGTMRSRIVGKRWVVNEIAFPSGTFSLQTLGYDEATGKFVGTWVDATSSFIWQYSGSLDATGRILILETKGPDLKDPTKMSRYRDSYEFTSKNEIAAKSQVWNEKDEWQTFSDSKMVRKAE